MFTLPELPYGYGALEPFIDEETMRIHHTKHHGAYVKNLNEALVGNDALLNIPIEELMQKLSTVPEEIRMKVRNNGGGHANHSMYWTLMSPADKHTDPQGALITEINNTFGSLMNMQEALEKSGLARFGSGWVWLVVSPSMGSTGSPQAGSGQNLTILDTPNQDTPLMEHKIPILGIDVWEHAYYLKYQNKRADYLKAFWNVVNWKEVERRFNESI